MYKTPGPASRPRPFLWEKREEMNIRHATGQDMDALCALYAEGRRFMAAHGNTAQWRGGYPQRAVLESDMRERRLYLCGENGALCAAFTSAFSAIFCFFSSAAGGFLRGAACV